MPPRPLSSLSTHVDLYSSNTQLFNSRTAAMIFASRTIAALLVLCSLGWSAIGIDANVSRDGVSASTTIATPAFSTLSGNELLLAFVSTDKKGANTTVTNVTGAGLTWALVRRTNAQNGDAEVWRAFAASPLTNVTVTATLSASV